MGFSVLAISDMNRNIEGTRIDMKVIQVELARTVENKYIYIQTGTGPSRLNPRRPGSSYNVKIIDTIKTSPTFTKIEKTSQRPAQTVGVHTPANFTGCRLSQQIRYT